ncbi:MAG TPA: FAD-dependent oxidoreductase [Xanthobacteraceae bacterium]|nr:FAD-dependent oxidoreductase [Xanthobacteraceae bacterium]
MSDQAGHQPSWYTATAVPRPERAPLTADQDVDVCVVGAGLAGLTTAREIARSGWSVAVLEAGRIAWNASGQNCGFVLPGFGANIDDIVNRVGLRRAKDLWALSQAGLEYVRATIHETGMPGVDPIDGWLNVSKLDDTERIVGTLQLLGNDLGAEVEGWATDRVRDVLKSDRYFNAIHFPRAFHLHPLNYALGLAAAAEQAGAHIFEGTPAVAIDPAGVRKRIETPHGRLRAAHVVLAGNVHIGDLMPNIAATLLPVWTYLATTAPLGPRLSDAVTYYGAVSDGERADNHYRIVDGDRLLISGRATMWEADPGRFAGALAADIAELYPQLGAVEIEHHWSGVLGRTIHGMPQIGELSPGIWLASGFGGHGLNTTAMAGNLIAHAIVDGDDTWRLFLPFELIWSGGRIGRAAAQVGYWWRRSRDEINARKARAHAAGTSQAAPVHRRSTPETSPADQAAAPESVTAAAMAPPAVELPDDPRPGPLPVRMAEPLALEDDQPMAAPRSSRRAMNARRSNR